MNPYSAPREPEHIRLDRQARWNRVRARELREEADRLEKQAARLEKRAKLVAV